jgi:hypothetical protein
MHGTNVKIIQTIILSVCHIRKEHRLRMFDSRMLNRRFGTNWEKVKGIGKNWEKVKGIGKNCVMSILIIITPH